MITLMMLIGAHSIGDYALQSDYIASQKGKDLWVLTMHTFIWTTCISFMWLALGHTLTFVSWALILYIPHWVLDYVKSHGCSLRDDKKALWLDQGAHMVQLVVLMLLG